MYDTGRNINRDQVMNLASQEERPWYDTHKRLQIFIYKFKEITFIGLNWIHSK